MQDRVWVIAVFGTSEPAMKAAVKAKFLKIHQYITVICQKMT